MKLLLLTIILTGQVMASEDKLTTEQEDQIEECIQAAVDYREPGIYNIDATEDEQEMCIDELEAEESK